MASKSAAVSGLRTRLNGFREPPSFFGELQPAIKPPLWVVVELVHIHVGDPLNVLSAPVIRSYRRRIPSSWGVGRNPRVARHLYRARHDNRGCPPWRTSIFSAMILGEAPSSRCRGRRTPNIRRYRHRRAPLPQPRDDGNHGCQCGLRLGRMSIKPHAVSAELNWERT